MREKLIKPELTLRLHLQHRGRTANNIQALGNLIFAGLVIPQFIPGVAKFSFTFALFGILGLTIAYFISTKIAKGGVN